MAARISALVGTLDQLDVRVPLASCFGPTLGNVGSMSMMACQSVRPPPTMMPEAEPQFGSVGFSAARNSLDRQSGVSGSPRPFLPMNRSRLSADFQSNVFVSMSLPSRLFYCDQSASDERQPERRSESEAHRHG